MEMTNTRIVPAPPAKVWAALNDPEALKASIPGCESLERISDDEWRAVMAAKVGPVSARFSGTMRMQDMTPPSGYTLKFEGQGGAAGFVARREGRLDTVVGLPVPLVVELLARLTAAADGGGSTNRSAPPPAEGG